MRFGAAAARVKLAGDGGRIAGRDRVRSRPGSRSGRSSTAPRCATVESLRHAAHGARLHRPTGCGREGEPACAATTSTGARAARARRRPISPAPTAQALAQRNEALRRVRAGAAGRESVAPWTARVAVLGRRLDAAPGGARRGSRARASRTRAETLGLSGRDARLRARSADRGGARGALRPRRRPGDDGARPAPARRRDLPRPAATCAATAPRASSARPCSR